MMTSDEFAASLRKTSHTCADLYFATVAGIPENAPSAIWEGHWLNAMDGLREGCRGMCTRLGFDQMSAQSIEDAALTFFLERFDQVNLTAGMGGSA